MLRVVVLCLIGSVCFKAQSQDSSQRVDDLLDRAKAIFKVDSDSAKLLEETALNLARKTSYSEGEVRAYFYLGYYHHKVSKDYKSAIENYLNSIHVSRPNHDSLTLGWSFYSNLQTALILGDFGLNEASLDFLKKARELAETLENLSELNKVDFWIYRRLASRGEYLDGLDILNEIVSRTPRGNEQYLNALNSIGVCNAYLGNFEIARSTYLEVIKLSQEHNNSTYEDYAFHNLGDLLIKNKQWDEAERVLEEVLNIKKSRERETKRDGNLLGTYKDLLRTKLQVGKPEFVLTIQDDLQTLIPDVQKTDPDYFFKIYPLMSKAYLALGNPEAASIYQRTYEIDSLAYLDIQGNLNFEIRRDELRAIVNAYYAELEKERKAVRSKNLLLSAIVGLSFLVVVLISYHFLSRYRVRKMLTQSLEQMQWKD